MTEAAFIDETFPFTEMELLQALLLTQPEEQAREMAAHVAGVVREAVEETAAARAARSLSRTPAEELQEAQWIVPDEGFAQLSFVSPELAERVDQFNAARWEKLREEDVRARMARAQLQSATPEIESEAGEVINAIRADWARVREAVRAAVERGTWNPYAT
jgi:hypothetical protein